MRVTHSIQTAISGLLDANPFLTMNDLARHIKVAFNIAVSESCVRGHVRSHGSARADSLDVLYVYKTKCTDKVESCMKLMLRERQYRKYKETYQIDLDALKKVIAACDDACMAPVYRRRGPSPQTGGYYAVILKD